MVARRRVSSYEPGQRSSNWLTVEATLRGTFVLGGFTERPGEAPGLLSSLLLGSWDAGRLVYSGQAAVGFDRGVRTALRNRLDQLRTELCPFSDPPSLVGRTTWVRPELVGEVRFAQWTPDSWPRAPVLVGLGEAGGVAKVRERGKRKPAA